MNQYDFDKLLEKYLAGQCSAEEEELIRHWSDKMLEETTISLSQQEEQTIRRRIWKRISHTTGQHYFSIRYNWFGAGAVAALVMIVAGVFLWQQTTSNRPAARMPTDLPGTITIKNTSSKPQSVTLKDGSLVVLQAQSGLSYPNQFGEKNRRVYLQGEAFFDVKKDPAKPFIVHTGNLVTQVLGTSFTVKSYQEARSIEVLVTRGRVSVYEVSDKPSQGRNGVILVPNQKITFDKVSQTLTPGLVEAPTIIQKPETRTSFVFDGSPLTKVFAALHKAYSIEFIIESQALNNCKFTGDLNDLPLYLQLDLICKSVNARYERRGTTLFIHGEGCTD